MAKKQFKAESKRLLDLMINSIYTHKEIFLRELISNASDAIDKLYYRSLTEGNTGLSRDDFSIRLEPDKEARTLKIIDNGMGMTKEELEKNLGTIAKSGSLDFKTEMEKKEDVDIIGQFGVGFYSAFMVSDKVTVVSKAYGEDVAYEWESTGADGYTIKDCEKEGNGTEITLLLKADTEDENYSQYLETYQIKNLINKYSDYIRYPIQMMVEHQKLKEGTENEYETYSELETLNSMIPLWKKNKSELKDEDYNQFYKEKFYDFTDPAKVIHTNVEGVVSYTALLFIPGQAPYNYYTKEFEKGLQLYSSGVLIMEKCADLLPDYFSFVRGLVDSQDLSLNISREMLQHDRQLKAIAQRLEKKIKSELLSMLNTDREKYVEFFKNFGLQLKFGMYDKFGANKDAVKDLVMFYSSSEKALVTLSEYVSRMKPDQKYIYFASGESTDKIDKLPQTELLKDKGYEILYLTDDVDEFALQMLHTFEEKEFKSVSSDDLEIEESKEEKEAAEKQAEESKDMLECMKEALGDKVAEVRLSQRLKSHPVCLTAKGGLSIEMEKVLNSMPVDQKIQAERVLEINAKHPILETLNKVYGEDKEAVKKYAKLLYDQALLIEGLPVEDPVAFSNAVCELMTK
ncbi:molecular chaperone HtpG [Zhenpiania hominis]|uniref:Chaperone protein HtpG n=1 Tax=Zhenpiania hominis TaxID=2763644 RepID=A0A923NKE6_9FIRM|nr:molecular chaperone HtpG [Zhenpiania hominis]MBC6679530.1 molecular chaperone HtpG [Zhenpiania hominis]